MSFFTTLKVYYGALMEEIVIHNSKSFFAPFCQICSQLNWLRRVGGWLSTGIMSQLSVSHWSINFNSVQSWNLLLFGRNTFSTVSLHSHVLIVVDAVWKCSSEVQRPLWDGILEGILSASHIGKIHITVTWSPIRVNSCNYTRSMSEKYLVHATTVTCADTILIITVED